MLNQTILVGRLVNKPELIETENGIKVTNITLAVPRSFKNADGVYDTDYIPVKLWGSIAQNTAEWCEKGDLVGIKGRLQTTNYETEDETKNSKLEIIAEKVTFLASRKKEEENEGD